MYGQTIRIRILNKVIEVFVFGLPSYSEEQWQKLAREKVISSIREADVLEENREEWKSPINETVSYYDDAIFQKGE